MRTSRPLLSTDIGQRDMDIRINRLLVAASIAYVVPGLLLLFAADVVLARGAATPQPVAEWLAGELGAALVAMALLNWFQRHSLLGGIYGRPLLLANLLVTSNATFASLRMWRSDGDALYLGTAVIAGALLVAFGQRLFARGVPTSP